MNSLLVNWAPWSVLKYSGFFPFRASFKESFTAEIRLQSVGDSPGDDVTAVEIHHSHKINKSMLQTVRIDLMLFIRKGQSFSGINRFHPEYPHQTPGLVSTNFKSSPLQLPAHPPAAIYGKVQVNFVPFLKNPLVLLAESDSFVIERGPVEGKKFTLSPHTQFLMLLLHRSSFTALPLAFSVPQSPYLSFLKTGWRHTLVAVFSHLMI